MVFNFLTKCLLQMKGRGSIPFQWEVLVEELRMGERGVRQAHSQWYFPKAQSVFILWKRGTWVRRMRLGWGRVSCSILEEPRDLQCCQSSVLHKVLLNVSPENLRLDSVSSDSRQPRGRDRIVSNPSNLCAEGASLEFQLNALNINYN